MESSDDDEKEEEEVPSFLRCQWTNPDGGHRCPRYSVQSWHLTGHPLERRPIYDDVKANDALEAFCIEHLLMHWIERPQCRYKGCTNLISFRDLAHDVGISDKLIFVNNLEVPHDFAHSRMPACPIPGCRGVCLNPKRCGPQSCKGACVDHRTVSLYSHREFPLPFCFHHLGIQRNDLVRRYNVCPKTPFSAALAHLTLEEVQAQFVFNEFRPPCPALDARMCRVQGCDMLPAATSTLSHSAFGVEFGRLECKAQRTHEWFHTTYGAFEKCESPFCHIGCTRHEANLMPSHILPQIKTQLHNFARLDTATDRLICPFHAWKHPRDFPDLCVGADCAKKRKSSSVFCEEHDKRARLQAAVEWFRQKDAVMRASQPSPLLPPPSPVVAAAPVRHNSFNNEMTQLSQRIAGLLSAMCKAAQAKEEAAVRQAARQRREHEVNREHQTWMDRIIHDKIVPNGVWQRLRDATDAEHRIAGLTQDDVAFLARAHAAPQGSNDLKQRKAVEQLLPIMVRTDDRQRSEDEEDGVMIDEGGQGEEEEEDDGEGVRDEGKYNFRASDMPRIMHAREQGHAFEDGQAVITDVAIAARAGVSALRVPRDAFLQLLPFLNCDPSASITDVDAIDRSTLRGSPSDYEKNPFVQFMCAMLELLDRVTYDLQHPSIRQFTCLGWSTKERLPPDEVLSLLSLLFTQDDLVAARRLVIAYSCIAAHGRFHGKRVSATSCYRDYDQHRARITRRHATATKKGGGGGGGKALQVMPDDVDLVAAFRSELALPSSSSSSTSSSRVHGTGLQLAETLFLLVFASMMQRGRCPPINLYLRITTIYYTTCVVKDNEQRLYGIAPKETKEAKMAGKFYEMLQLVCCVIRGRLFHEPSLDIHAKYGVALPSSRTINEACWRWIVWLYTTPERRLEYQRTKYIKTNAKSGDHPFPRTSHKNLGTALDDMYVHLRDTLLTVHDETHVKVLQADPKTCIQGKTQWSATDIVSSVFRVLFEPTGKSNVVVLADWIATGRWPVEVEKKVIKRSEAAVQTENNERRHLGLPLLAVRVKERKDGEEKKEKKIGIKRKQREDDDDDDPSTTTTAKKDTPMVEVESTDLPKDVCGFVQFVDAVEATERALGRLGSDETANWDLMRRATVVFDKCMCGSKPDKTAVCILSFLAQEVSNKAKRRKVDKEEEKEVEFLNADEGKAFADYWIGIRSLTSATVTQQKSVLVPNTWSKLTSTIRFWVDLLSS
jgi:hypothetical protein